MKVSSELFRLATALIEATCACGGNCTCGGTCGPNCSCGKTGSEKIAENISLSLWKYTCEKGHTWSMDNPHGASSAPPKRVYCPLDKTKSMLERPIKRYRAAVSEGVLEEKKEEDSKEEGSKEKDS